MPLPTTDPQRDRDGRAGIDKLTGPTWLRHDGWLLATTGHEACTGTEQSWLGGTAVWWSHADAASYRATS